MTDQTRKVAKAIARTITAHLSKGAMPKRLEFVVDIMLGVNSGRADAALFLAEGLAACGGKRTPRYRVPSDPDLLSWAEADRVGKRLLDEAAPYAAAGHAGGVWASRAATLNRARLELFDDVQKNIEAGLWVMEDILLCDPASCWLLLRNSRACSPASAHKP